MGHTIPVFLLPVQPSQPVENGTVAEQLIGEAYGDPSSGIRSSESANWWHQVALRDMAHELDESALDFLSQPLVVLTLQELAAAHRALQVVTDALQSGAAPSGTDDLQLVASHIDLFASAPDEQYIAAEADDGPTAAVGFFSFVKSLSAAVAQSLDAGHYLLWYQPQP